MSGMRSLIRKYGTLYTGMLAHLIQRATGLLLLIYLFLHVRTIRQLSLGAASFDAAVGTFRHPVFKLFEIALLATVILHALNGVRITLLDLGWGHAKQRRILWFYAIGLGAILFLAGSIPLILARFL